MTPFLHWRSTGFLKHTWGLSWSSWWSSPYSIEHIWPFPCSTLFLFLLRLIRILRVFQVEMLNLVYWLYRLRVWWWFVTTAHIGLLDELAHGHGFYWSVEKHVLAFSCGFYLRELVVLLVVVRFAAGIEVDLDLLSWVSLVPLPQTRRGTLLKHHRRHIRALSPSIIIISAASSPSASSSPASSPPPTLPTLLSLSVVSEHLVPPLLLLLVPLIPLVTLLVSPVSRKIWVSSLSLLLLESISSIVRLVLLLVVLIVVIALLLLAAGEPVGDASS